MCDTIASKIQKYRTATYQILPNDRIQTKAEAVDYINRRGFILFHPSKDIKLPTLWQATNGDRSVPIVHDDPGHITWQWKDELLGERKCYYGRLLGKKMSFISLAMLPSFFRLTDNIEYEEDYLLIYQKGEMSYEAKQMYEVLLYEGPLDTLELRKRAGLWGRENQYRYTKNLNWLQQNMMVVPIGVAAVGRWNYAFIYDILPRFFPDLVDQTQDLKLSSARVEILRKYFKSVGAADEVSIRKLFFWKPKSILRSLHELQEAGWLQSDVEVKGEVSPQWVITDLLI
jgi:hypothetical protein